MEKFLYLSQLGPNKGKWVEVSEKACLNLASQGLQVKKVVVTEKETDFWNENDPWKYN